MWYVNCFIESELQFAVNCYKTNSLDTVLELVRNTIGRRASGIDEVEIVYVSLRDGEPGYFKVHKSIRFRDVKVAEEKLKLWLTFS